MAEGRTSESPMQVKVSATGQNYTLFSYATRINSHGLFIRASRHLPVGTEVMLSLRVSSGSAPVRALGQVTRIQGSPGRRGMEMSLISSGDSTVGDGPSRVLSNLIKKTG